MIVMEIIDFILILNPILAKNSIKNDFKKSNSLNNWRIKNNYMI